MSSYSRFFYNAIMPRLHANKSIRILDFGCGRGENLKSTLLTLPNATIFGCDIKNKILQAGFEYNETPLGKYGSVLILTKNE